MRELTSSAIVALHALHLMMQRNMAVTLEEIQESSGFPRELIRGVMPGLLRGNLIRRSSGRGYVLSRAPGEISLQQILEAVEEPRAPTAPCNGDFEKCDSRASCLLAPLCRSADREFVQTLRSFTLSELRDQPPGVPNCLDPRFRAEAT
jgi:Rrf2 family protein